MAGDYFFLVHPVEIPLKLQPKTAVELKVMLQSVWGDLPLKPIKRITSIMNVRKQITKYLNTSGGHLEHSVSHQNISILCYNVTNLNALKLKTSYVYVNFCMGWF